MNTQFKIKPLVILITSALVLAGCNSGSDDTVKSQDPGSNNGSTTNPGDQGGQTPPTEEQETAKINIAAKFPEPEITPAWVGNSQLIEVKFFRNDFVGTLDEAQELANANQQCFNYNDYYPWEESFTIGDRELNCWDINNDNYYKQRFAKIVELEPESPSATINLVPGKYRVEAVFFDDKDEIRETSVSYITITEGSHNIALRGMSATWTATSPLTLQLVNTNDDNIDWDPRVDGIQSAAEALGVTSEILGLHLPSLMNYPDGMPNDSLWEGSMAFATEVLTTRWWNWEDQSAVFAPVWRLKDGNGEKDLHLSAEYISDSEDYYNAFSLYSSLAGHFQDYSEGVNRSFMDLGLRSVYRFQETDTSSLGSYAEVRLGLTTPPVNEEAENTERFVSYEETNTEYYDYRLQEWIPTTVKRAQINTSMSESGWSQVFFELLENKANVVVDGSTITGHLIEILETNTRSGQDVTPAIFLNAALNEIAVQQGLQAQALSAESCKVGDFSNQYYSNEYIWDEEGSQWVAGVLNPYLASVYNGWSNFFYDLNRQRSQHNDNIAYQQEYITTVELEIADLLNQGVSEEDWEITWRRDNIANSEGYIAQYQGDLNQLQEIENEYMLRADLNGDGEAELIETGVYLDNDYYGDTCELTWNYIWDEELQNEYMEYSMSCDNAPVVSTTVRADSTEGSFTICAQPFTLKASELSIEYPTDGNVIID